MPRIALTLDAIINACKWPVALLAIAVLPFALGASLRLVGRIITAPLPLAAFIVGLILYVAAWQLVLKHRIFGTFFSTLEHELTHALFALATLHPVSEIRSTFRGGGHIRFQTYGGQGNWLIAVAPYFFPTVCFAILTVGIFIPPAWRWWVDAVLGSATAYHVLSTMHETHGGQTDLQRVGFFFSLCFLPAANLISFGLIIAFVYAGRAGVGEFLSDLTPNFLGG